ncbi:MAG TPA: permease [Bacillota bacterium]|nr:permease [Bacillota bacterium]
MQSLIIEMATEVVKSLFHNWIPLTLALVTIAVMTAYIKPEKLKDTLLKKPNVSIFGSVAAGAFTPLCACGTMAVIIAMLTTTLPWGPIMAFLTSSPLMSPDGFILLAGVIGLKFAVALAVASIVIGLVSGYLTHLIEAKTNYLKDQVRFAGKAQSQSCACGGEAPVQQEACNSATCPACGHVFNPPLVTTIGLPLYVNEVAAKAACTNTFWGALGRIKWGEMKDAFVDLGLKKIIPYFALFVAVGYLINRFIPSSLIMALFSAKNIFAVPLAALIGLPLYVTNESSIPLIKSLMAGGASGGSMLAFMITGQATSAWVIAGIATFMKRRVIGLYLAYLVVGGILMGYLYDLYLLFAR